ncbi:MAG: RNA 2',3'-cyclic phosphodiesterase, partial [Deltaproteobacteria bacterium]|nr:RNA 2',3'-cyclic phosphodiesterase [Deltaproteobacteria bacterium]
KFLGEVPLSNLEFLKQILTRETQALPTFEMQFGSLGCFPNPRQPRVIWIGLQAPSTLAMMQQNIETAADKLGYTREERTFSPHLTLGRVRQAVSAADIQRIRTTLAGMQLGRIEPLRVDSIHLFKSDLRPSGSVYTKIFSATMKQQAVNS